MQSLTASDNVNLQIDEGIIKQVSPIYTKHFKIIANLIKGFQINQFRISNLQISDFTSLLSVFGFDFIKTFSIRNVRVLNLSFSSKDGTLASFIKLG
jgi:hypothetical protein